MMKDTGFKLESKTKLQADLEKALCDLSERVKSPTAGVREEEKLTKERERERRKLTGKCGKGGTTTRKNNRRSRGEGKHGRVMKGRTNKGRRQ